MTFNHFIAVFVALFTALFVPLSARGDTAVCTFSNGANNQHIVYGQHWVTNGTWWYQSSTHPVAACVYDTSSTTWTLKTCTSEPDDSDEYLWLVGNDEDDDIYSPATFENCTTGHRIYTWDSFWDGYVVAEGGDGSDMIEGADGDDILAGEGDGDILYGMGGVNELYAGDYGDTTCTDTDDEELYIGNGDDDSGGLGYGCNGADEFNCGDNGFGGGDVTTVGGSYSCVAYTRNGQDEFHGADGDDLVYKGSALTGSLLAIMMAGDDKAYGGSGDDTLQGRAGDDLLVSYAGNDMLMADGPREPLGGDPGDSLYCGSEATWDWAWDCDVAYCNGCEVTP